MANGANGAHPAGPATFPRVVGADGVGRLPDGSRVAFFGPQQPYGGTAEETLVRVGAWFPVPDGVDDVTAAAVLNRGGAAWKTIVWEGSLAAGEVVLMLGATGMSGRIATQLASQQGARVVAAGRNQRILGELARRGADATIRVDRPHDDLIAAIAGEGPYDPVVDYVWGPVAEAVFAALARIGRSPGDGPRQTRYVQVGMTAGEVAGIPAMALRTGGVHLTASGSRGPVPLADAAAAYASLHRQVDAGEIDVEVAPVPLASVEHTWPQSANGRRIVFVP